MDQKKKRRNDDDDSIKWDASLKFIRQRINENEPFLYCYKEDDIMFGMNSKQSVLYENNRETQKAIPRT